MQEVETTKAIAKDLDCLLYTSHLCQGTRQYGTAARQETQAGPGADCESGHIVYFRYGSADHLFRHGQPVFGTVSGSRTRSASGTDAGADMDPQRACSIHLNQKNENPCASQA